eukprot:364166-Chlamydomonas_euryale.AAC.11
MSRAQRGGAEWSAGKLSRLARSLARSQPSSCDEDKPAPGRAAPPLAATRRGRGRPGLRGAATH